MNSLSAASEVNGGSAPSFVQNQSWCQGGVSWRSKIPEADLWGRSRGLLFLLKPLMESSNNDWLCLSLGRQRQLKFCRMKNEQKIKNKGFLAFSMIYWIFLVTRSFLEYSLLLRGYWQSFCAQLWGETHLWDKTNDGRGVARSFHWTAWSSWHSLDCCVTAMYNSAAAGIYPIYAWYLLHVAARIMS